MPRLMYHLAPSSAREKIRVEGLEPRWGGGFATGQSPLQGSIPLKGVYLSLYPGLIGVEGQTPFEGLTQATDIWEVDVSGLELLPDFPALVEHGAMAEPTDFWFEDNERHRSLSGGSDTNILYCEALRNPEPFIKLTGTAMVTVPIGPERLRLRGQDEFAPGQPMPYE